MTMSNGVLPLVDRLAIVLSPQIKKGQHICVGLSGGMDSVVLLDMLDQLEKVALVVQVTDS